MSDNDLFMLVIAIGKSDRNTVYKKAEVFYKHLMRPSA